jgi:hypothetical protein
LGVGGREYEQRGNDGDGCEEELRGTHGWTLSDKGALAWGGCVRCVRRAVNCGAAIG